MSYEAESPQREKYAPELIIAAVDEGVTETEHSVLPGPLVNDEDPIGSAGSFGEGLQ